MSLNNIALRQSETTKIERQIIGTTKALEPATVIARSIENHKKNADAMLKNPRNIVRIFRLFIQEYSNMKVSNLEN